MLSARVPECRHRSSQSARQVSVRALRCRSAAAWQRGCACAANSSSAESVALQSLIARSHGQKSLEGCRVCQLLSFLPYEACNAHAADDRRTQNLLRPAFCKSSAQRPRYVRSSSWSSQRSQKPFACCRCATHSKHLVQWPQTRSNHQLWTKRLLSSTLCAPSCAVRQMVARPALMQQLPAAQQWMLPRQ